MLSCGQLRVSWGPSVANLRHYTKVALLGAITTCFMATILTGFVLDIVLVVIALGLTALWWKL